MSHSTALGLFIAFLWAIAAGFFAVRAYRDRDAGLMPVSLTLAAVYALGCVVMVWGVFPP